jgi:glycogen debranching enzyme
VSVERLDDPLVRIRPLRERFVSSRGRCVLVTRADGAFAAEDAGCGLFFHQTRVLSRHRLTIDGEAPIPVALSAVAQSTWLGYYIRLAPGLEPGPADAGSGQVPAAAQRALELRIGRRLDRGLHEHLDLANFSGAATRFVLELELEADFADREELAGTRLQRGRTSRAWSEEGALDFAYRASGPAGTIDRGLEVAVRSATPARPTAAGVAFDVALDPGERWHACVDYRPRTELERAPPPRGCPGALFARATEDPRRRHFLEEATRVLAPGAGALATDVVEALGQARRDLADLRLEDLDSGSADWTLAAGVPMFVALFGRDALTASWQSALLGPEAMAGTLRVLARLQGTRVDDWRDEQPGRMLHEAHTGPLAALGHTPRRRYYGSITTSGFYPLVVSELWHWTGDRSRVEPFVRPALEALAWLDRDSDRDGDGFYEYRTRSPQGVRHQAWKDSEDAIVDTDGRDVAPPLATCEEQGFVYLAKLHLAEVLWWLDRKDEARRLHREALELKRRFAEAFWMEEEGFVAMARGPDGRAVRAIGSNAGHCLATGVLEEDAARRVARRLLAPDLFSGWGVRTLSADNPAYNPYSYHRGSVWPVEHGSFAIGLVRYGFHDELERLCRGMFEAARRFDGLRLPELFSGHPRDAEHPFPALYPQASSPQAWSASTLFTLLQSLLGLYPYAPLGLLLVDPHLPAWLPELRLEGLRVGEATVSLRFTRTGARSDFAVTEQHGALRVLRQPSPWSLTATWAERLRDLVSSFV